MATYRTSLAVQLDTGQVFRVESDKTFYRAAVMPETVHLYGPGVDETYDLGEDIPTTLSPQHQALLAVLLWEDQV